MEDIEFFFKKATAYHGKLCPGMIIGVRMALLGLEKINITDPEGTQRKDVMAFVENDRCIVDAIQAIANCKVSSRALKLYDYGKVAATFLNLKTQKAYRIVCPERTRELVDQYAPSVIQGKKERAIAAYKEMPLGELFVVSEVEVDVKSEDMPGHATYKVDCEKCGESVSDHREISRNGKVFCKPCADGGYYRTLREVV